MHDRDRTLILASSSPRRRSLLKRLKVPFEVITSDLEETFERGLSAQQVAESLALQKALAVSRHFPERPVLAGDTLILLQGEILGKPRDPEEARQMLASLRGRSHQVISGLAVLLQCAGLRFSSTIITEVRMKNYSAGQIRDYVAGGEPLDKAGAYALQGQGGKLVKKIEGCYTNVVGLPLCETAILLRHLPCMAAVPLLCTDAEGGTCPRVSD